MKKFFPSSKKKNIKLKAIDNGKVSKMSEETVTYKQNKPVFTGVGNHKPVTHIQNIN